MAEDMIVVTPNNHWIRLQLQGLHYHPEGRDKSGYMISTNDLEWEDKIDAELEYKRYGLIKELEPRLIEFATSHGLKVCRLKNGTSTLIEIEADLA